MAKPKKVVPTLLVEDVKPGEDSDFRWKITDVSKAWRFLLNGNIKSIVKFSSITCDFDAKEICELLQKIINDGKGQELVNTIKIVSSEGLAVRVDAVVFALAVCTCSDKLEVKSKAYDLLNEICSQSSHFLQFVDFHEKICKMVRNTTGWSRGHRKAVQKWYCKEPPLQMARTVVKCLRHNHWTHKDVMRLAHISPPLEGHKILSSYVVAGLKSTVEKFRTETSKGEEINEGSEVLRYLERVSMLKSNKDPKTVVPEVMALKLPWNLVPSQLSKDAEFWKGLMSYLPLDVLVSHVCCIAKLHLFDNDSQEKTIFIQKCKDAAAVKASGMHPYSILMHRETYSNAMKDEKRKISWNVDPLIVEALNEAFESSIQNLVPTGKRYFITIDASSSMKAHIINNNHVQCRMAAACMALCIARTEKKVVLKAFSKELAEIKIDKSTKLEDIVNCLEETPLGGTDCSRPIIFAKGKKLKTDVFIVITDKETWSGKTSPREALCQFRKTVKIPAKLVVIALNVEGTSDKVVADPEDRGMLDIFGFSPTIPRIVHNFAKYDY